MGGAGRRRVLAVVVAILGAAATVGGLVVVAATEGSWVGQAQVAIFPPAAQPDDNPLAGTDDQAVRFASVIDQVVDNAERPPRVTSRDLTLADQGLRHDSEVSLVNLGGQWADDFSRPYLRIEAVDSTEAATRARLEASVDQVVDTLERLQDQAAVGEEHRATARVLPAPRTWFEETHESRGLLATALLGSVLTFAAVGRVLRGVGSRSGRPPRAVVET